MHVSNLPQRISASMKKALGQCVYCILREMQRICFGIGWFVWTISMDVCP